MRALISVSDKSCLDKLAKGLVGLGYEIVSTGGSAKAIDGMGVPVTRVEELTGFPEMLDGAVSGASNMISTGMVPLQEEHGRSGTRGLLMAGVVLQGG